MSFSCFEGFENFFPKGKGKAKPRQKSTEKTNKKSNNQDGGGQGSSRGPGGDNGIVAALTAWLQNPQNRPLIISTAVVVALSTLLMNTGPNVREITWQDFRNSYLERGAVMLHFSCYF